MDINLALDKIKANSRTVYFGETYVRKTFEEEINTLCSQETILIVVLSQEPSNSIEDRLFSRGSFFSDCSRNQNVGDK